MILQEAVTLFYFNIFFDFLAIPKFTFACHCTYFFVTCLHSFAKLSIFSIKAFPTITFRNKCCRSWDKSRLQSQIFLYKSWRATMCKVRFTKLLLYVHLLRDIRSIFINELFESWFFSRVYKKPSITDSEFCYQQLHLWSNDLSTSMSKF